MSISGINNEDDDFESDFKPKKSNKSKKIKKLESSDEDDFIKSTEQDGEQKEKRRLIFILK